MDLAIISNGVISLFTLAVLEIVLGVDNLIFISMASNRLPSHQQKLARRVGLLLALGTRLVLLACVVWIMGLQKPWFTLFNQSFSIHDLVCIAGGLFLLYKATSEIHGEFEVLDQHHRVRKFARFSAIVIQIAIFDIVFSLDSILTAIGLTQNFYIMACAIILAAIVMILGSEYTSRFIKKRPSIRMLAWSFLLLIGVALIADGFHFHIPRAYIYFAVCFSIVVEVLNLSRRHRKHKTKSP